MINNMAFGVPCVRDFLATHGHVITVRGYNYSSPAATVKGIGTVRRVKLGEVKSEEDIAGFTQLSGFGTVGEWWHQIKRFCGGRMWAYRVTIDENATHDAEKYQEERQQHRANRPLIDEITHPLDRDPALVDPALVDLQTSHDDFVMIQNMRERERREHRREIMQEQLNETRRVPAPRSTEDVMEISDAERALAEITGGSHE